jgi:hypothetical protein
MRSFVTLPQTSMDSFSQSLVFQNLLSYFHHKSV